MRSNRIFWALILVLFGFVLLANNLGIISVNIWRFFWPVLLIVLGVWFLVGTAMGPADVELLSGSVDLEDAKSASVTVKHGAGRLVLDGIAEPGKLVSGQFAFGLETETRREGDNLNVVMKPSRPAFPDMFFPGNWIGGKGLEWNFGVSDEIPVDLTFEIGAVDARLDLSSLKVRNLALETGASSTRIMLPKAAGMTYLKVEAGAASVEIEVPEGVEARIDAEAGLASLDVDQARFPKTNGIYQSSGYDTAENKVDIRIETGVSSIEIR